MCKKGTIVVISELRDLWHLNLLLKVGEWFHLKLLIGWNLGTCLVGLVNSHLMVFQDFQTEPVFFQLPLC